MTMAGPGWGREGDVPVSDERGGHFPPNEDPWSSGAAYGQSDPGSGAYGSQSGPVYGQDYSYAPPPPQPPGQTGTGWPAAEPAAAPGWPAAEPAATTGWPVQPPAYNPV